MSDVISKLSAIFGNEAPLTINRGSHHDYLGMTLYFSRKGKVTIGMNEYIQDLIRKLPSDMFGLALTPAANHLFQVHDSDPEYLPEREAISFHHLVAKLLFLCK